MNDLSRQSLVAACLLAMALTVDAQEQPASAAPDDIVEEIIVTGSRIPRRDYFALSPIVSVDRQEIALTGDLQANYLLNSLPQVDPGLGAGTGNTFEGTSRINLRGLGDFRSLVLLNGRRYANSNVFGATDLNSLPPVMLERVEVITGGASAVYGSDAVAGAVNFILRNDFEGLDTSLQYGVSHHGDADTFSADVAWGTTIGGGDGHIAAFLNYYDRTEVFQDARAFSRDPQIANNDTGEIDSGWSLYSGAGTIDGDLGVDLYTFDPDGRPRLFVDPDDRYNTSSENALLAPMTRTSAGVFGNYSFSESFAGSIELIFTRSEPKQRRDDIYVDFVSVNTDRPDITPELQTLLATDYDPDGDSVADFLFVKRFTVDRGPVLSDSERDFFRSMLGLTGAIGSDWRWSADFSYTNTNWQNRTFNDISVSRVQQGLLVDPLTGECFDLSNGCVPVNPFGEGNLSAAASEFIALDESGIDEDVTEQMFNVTVSGEPLETWAGSIDVVAGAEYRETRIRLTPTESVGDGDSVYWGTQFIQGGSISVAEAFAEATVPLAVGKRWANYLGLEVGARISDYDSINDKVDTWKIGAEWETNFGVRFRAMLQRAIRAPGSESFQEDTFAGIGFGLGPFFDQCSASRDPVGNGLEELCIAQGIPPSQIGVFEATFFPTIIERAGNPDLGAEDADTLTLGIVWQPDTSFPISVSLDYFDIELDNAITNVGPVDALALCFASRNAESTFCQTFSREAGGNIEIARGGFFNAAVARAEGFDFALDTEWDAPSLATIGSDATIRLAFAATHYITVGTQPTPLSPFFDCPGRFGALCDDFVFQGAMPEFRSNSRLTYTSGPVSASLRWTFIDSMRNSENEFRALIGRPLGIEAIDRLPSKSYFDFSIDADLPDDWYLTFGIVNLFDEPPPFIGDGSRNSANTDPSTYDVLGRRYFLRVGAAF